MGTGSGAASGTMSDGASGADDAGALDAGVLRDRLLILLLTRIFCSIILHLSSVSFESVQKAVTYKQTNQHCLSHLQAIIFY